MATPLIAPSLLSCDFSRLAEELAAVEVAGADVHHVDVMDGRFVPNLTWGPPIVAAMKRHAKRPLDCHLMIVEPEKYIDAFAKAGADWISIHVEATVHVHRAVQQIAHAGCKPGVVLNPGTPVAHAAEVLSDVHHVLVMSVNPGFGGQSFIPHAHQKVRELAALRLARGLDFKIEIDGGIKPENARAVCRDGAEILVAGSAVFGEPDYAKAIAAIRSEAQAGCAERG